LKEALSILAGHLNPENGTATDEVNREMANEIGGQVDISYFIYSTGWLNLFKQNLEFSEHIKGRKTTGINFESLCRIYCSRDTNM
jgi:hypothetical protein